jgi:hypothetical protein
MDAYPRGRSYAVASAGAVLYAAMAAFHAAAACSGGPSRALSLVTFAVFAGHTRVAVDVVSLLAHPRRFGRELAAWVHVVPFLTETNDR